MKRSYKNISYILQFVDSSRFMANAFSYLVNSLSEGIHKIKCKYGHNNKKCETCRTKYKCCGCFFEYRNSKDNRIQMFILQQKFSTKIWWKVKGTIF